jgi:ABC-type sugar transport system ATPase subunit
VFENCDRLIVLKMGRFVCSRSADQTPQDEILRMIVSGVSANAVRLSALLAC